MALLFFGAGILYTQHFLFPGESFTMRKPLSDGSASILHSGVISASSTQPFLALEKKSVLQTKEGSYVASKNGTKYYALACKNQIKEENKVYFQTELDAQKAGFGPSKTCFK